MEDLLRAYIREALQLELRMDPKMMAMLRGTGVREPDEPDAKEAREIAEEWIEDHEATAPYHRTRIHRYVARKWPVLLRRFNGNKHAALQTLYNLLDTRSSEDRHR